MHKNKEEKKEWDILQVLAQNAVVQVFAQVARFDWLQPYKIESQFESRGTGFLISDDGLFITNAHVVSEARRIWVHIPLLGLVPLAAHVVGICPETDLALLRLQEDAITYIKQQLGSLVFFELGDSDGVKPTDTVLALGYPLGQNHVKTTSGVISGKEFIDGNFLIQITAPVNPGNSGGPLITMDGKVVGIAVAGVMEAQNVGYAIPVKELRSMLPFLKDGGLVRKPKLGIALGYANDEKARFFGNPEPAGLYIRSVVPGSLADNAGIHEGDMLYELNGYTIDAFGQAMAVGGLGRMVIYDLVTQLEIGSIVQMVVYRQGKRIDISFTYEVQLPLPIRRLYPGYEPVPYEMMGGMVIMPLSDDHMELLGAYAPDLLSYRWERNRLKGALVITAILPGSYIYQMGTFSPGDTIRYVNNTRVHDLASLRRAIRKSVDSGLLAIKMDNDALVVLSLAKMIDDEERLSTDFVYPMSQTIKYLQRALKNRGA
jgi:serine protease Do